MPTEMASWHEVATRLASERSYWLATVAADGAPHVSPIWGAVVGEVWHFYTERTTVKARNLAADPRVVVHVGDGEDALIVHGQVRDLGHPGEHRDVVDAFATKYTRPTDLGFLPLADPSFDVLYALSPARALAWRLADYDGSQRRWRAM